MPKNNAARANFSNHQFKAENRQHNSVLDVRTTRALISKLNNILRDQDSHSNIIERFDELTKLLFFKLFIDEKQSSSNELLRKDLEEDHQYASRIRENYTKASGKVSFIPKNFAVLKANDPAIIECASILSKVSFKGVGFDLKGLAYEEVIKNTFDKNDNQQFFTPPSIVKFMVDMLSENLQGDICDPAAGTGGFLVEIIKSGASFRSLTALEIDERLAWVSGINLFSHGARNAKSHWLPQGGTLGYDAKRFFNSFDAIITNPPFGSDFTDLEQLKTYCLGGNRSSRRRGILFLERCYELLRPGGILAFVIDEGVLNLPSAEDVRQFITENFVLHGIISLPETAFMPYATVSASILFLQKPLSNKQKNQKTFFAKAEKIGRKGNGDEDIIFDDNGIGSLNSDLPEIISLFRSFRKTGKAPSSELAYIADVTKNLKEDVNNGRLDFRYHHPSRIHSSTQLAKTQSTLVPLTSLCDERNQTLIPCNELSDQIILYTGLANIESYTGVACQVPTPANSLKSAVKRYEPGDIIFAKMRPNLRKVALMQFKEGGYVSAECIVLTVKKEKGITSIDPLLLSVLLRSDLVYGQIMHLIAGIGRPRLAVSDLRRVLIPSANSKTQKKWRAEYLADIENAKDLKRKAEELFQKATHMELAAVEQLSKEFIK